MTQEDEKLSAGDVARLASIDKSLAALKVLRGPHGGFGSAAKGVTVEHNGSTYAIDADGFYTRLPTDRVTLEKFASDIAELRRTELPTEKAPTVGSPT